jgi:hypothetical protein
MAESIISITGKITDCQKGSFAKLQIALFGAFLILLSCATTKDISEDKVLRGNYRKGLIIESKKDTLLMYDNYISARLRALEGVKEYGLSDEYKGVVKKGTKLKILRIELYQHIENGKYIYPMALILDGQWKGEKVNLHYTSRSSESPHNASYHIDILDVDPEVFEIVNE